MKILINKFINIKKQPLDKEEYSMRIISHTCFQDENCQISNKVKFDFTGAKIEGIALLSEFSVVALVDGNEVNVECLNVKGDLSIHIDEVDEFTFNKIVNLIYDYFYDHQLNKSILAA